jgi:hypothetical protein
MNRKITIDLKRAAWVLALGVVFVDFVSGCFSIANYFLTHNVHLSPETSKIWPWLFMKFYLDTEYNFPTYYASFTILLCAFLLGIITLFLIRKKSSHLWQWTALTFIFLLLSLDEYMGFHEVFGGDISHWLFPKGVFASAWVVPGLVVVIVLGLAYLPFIFHLPPRTRNLVILSAVIYVGGALVMDAISGYYVTLYGMGNLGYELQVYVEETMEMAGIALFTYTLLEYLKLLLASQPLEITIE